MTSRTARSLATTTVLAAALSLGVVVGPGATAAPATAKTKVTSVRTASTTSTTSTTLGSWTLERATSPARTLVKDSSGRLVATYTDGSRTVTVTGPARTFAESTTTAVVTTTAWVRLLPAPFAGTVDADWLNARLADRSPDVLAVAMAYTTGAPEVRDAAGALVSSDASYGPLVDGARQEGSDWNDYYGVTATYDGKADAPEADQLGALDCSGFVRLVFGHRGGIPMSIASDGVRLPRRAVQMDASAPGTLVVKNTGKQVTTFGRLLAGDLVFFDASTDDGTAIDHVGVYLGKDSAGRPRFVSSRKSVDGPTMGDVRGRSVLDGTGLYATSFRSIRRL